MSARPLTSLILLLSILGELKVHTASLSCLLGFKFENVNFDIYWEFVIFVTNKILFITSEIVLL